MSSKEGSNRISLISEFLNMPMGRSLRVSSEMGIDTELEVTKTKMQNLYVKDIGKLITLFPESANANPTFMINAFSFLSYLQLTTVEV